MIGVPGMWKERVMNNTGPFQLLAMDARECILNVCLRKSGRSDFLRHTFCVKSMIHLAREGKDLYYILPILSTYIGHQSLAATDRYVRMTSEMYPDLLSQTDSICSYIFSDLK